MDGWIDKLIECRRHESIFAFDAVDVNNEAMYITTVGFLRASSPDSASSRRFLESLGPRYASAMNAASYSVCVLLSLCLYLCL